MYACSFHRAKRLKMCRLELQNERSINHFQIWLSNVGIVSLSNDMLYLHILSHHIQWAMCLTWMPEQKISFTKFDKTNKLVLFCPCICFTASCPNAWKTLLWLYTAIVRCFDCTFPVEGSSHVGLGYLVSSYGKKHTREL